MTSLRDIAASDYPLLKSLRRDAELQRMLMGAPQGSDEPVEDWVGRRMADGWIRAVADDTDSCIGYVQLSDIHRSNRTAWFGICLAEATRGRGHGGQATAATLEAATGLGLRKVSLKVRTDNPAQKLYRSLGFRDVGTQVAEYDDGDAVHDVLIMERLLKRDATG